MASTIDWPAVFAGPVVGFSMKNSETRKGNRVISIRELRGRTTVPHEAWRKYREALSEDEKGHYLESLRLAQSATTLYPKFSQAHAALTIWHLRNLDLASAERESRIASDLDPYSLPTREISGIVFLMAGNISKARNTLEAVVAADSTRILAQYFLASALSASGESALAAKHFETANQLRRRPPKPSTVEWSLAPE